MSKSVEADVLTGLIITFNEENNIERTLSKLTWLKKIIIVDSGSTDETIDIIKQFKNIEIHFRPFDSFAVQCNYGLSLISSPWVLSLDADYVLSEEFSKEILHFLSNSSPQIVAYTAGFNFLVFCKALRANNTTDRAVLFRKEFCSYYNDGHAHRLLINGRVGSFKNKIDHDDRKPLSRWIDNQNKYSVQEAAKLSSMSADKLSFTSKLRKTKIFAPVIVFFYCLFIKGLIFKGWRGWHYTLQRTIAEMLISLRLIERRLDNK